MLIGTHVDDMFPLFNRPGQKHMTVENKGILSFALDTKIERDAEKGILKISQPVYIAGIVQEFNRENPLKTRDTPSSGTTITEEILPQTEEEKEKVAKLPIRNLIGSFGGWR